MKSLPRRTPGIHSATPYQCLNDGWVLDTEAMEWKRIQFKASLTGQKGSYNRRMTGLIQDRPIPAATQAAILGRRGSASKLMMGKSGKLGFLDIAGGAAAATRQSKIAAPAPSAGGSKM